MPIAELVLDTSPNDFESFYFKATDQSTSLVVLVASKSQIARLLENAGDAPGLYVLQAEDSTVYVGQSKVLGDRLRNHKASNKIGYRRVMVMLRDQSLSRYLDYGEAKLFETLRTLGYRLEQSSLSGSLDAKRARLASMDKEHVVMADALVTQFLAYSVALGLVKPVVAVVLVAAPVEPIRPSPDIRVDPVPLPQDATGLASSALPVTSTNVPAIAIEPKPGVRLSATSALAVRRRDGKAFEGKTATDVFFAALVDAGLADVAALALMLAGEPLVGTVKSTKYPSASRACGPWFVLTHSNTNDKARRLRQVSEALGLDWVVAVLEENPVPPAPILNRFPS